MHGASGKSLSGALSVGQISGWKPLVEGETIELLLNLNIGSISVFRNSEYVGTPLRGLPRLGYFWMVQLSTCKDAVGIEAMQPPPVPLMV